MRIKIRVVYTFDVLFLRSILESINFGLKNPRQWAIIVTTKGLWTRLNREQFAKMDIIARGEADLPLISNVR